MKVPIVRKACNAEDWKEQVKKWNTQPSEVIIENVITITQKEFDSLCKDFFKDRNYITENLEKMYYDDEKKIWHCILVITEDSNFYIGIQSEGYSYARYSFVVSKQDYTKQYRERCYCADCDSMYICIHKDCFRRMPKEIGGLALCPKLADNSDPIWRECE